MINVNIRDINYALILYADDLYASSYRYQRFKSGSNIAGGIEGSNQTSVVYSASSDYRMKKNIKPLENGLERLSKLKPVKFDWKLNDQSTEGFIAHEVQELFPDAVTGVKDAMSDEEFELTPRVEEVRDEEGNVITEAVEAVMEMRSVPNYQGIDYGRITPLLVKAIQEQQTIIEDLKLRIETLEG